MTERQAARLRLLAEEAAEPMPTGLPRAQAEDRIRDLRERGGIQPTEKHEGGL